MPDEPTPTPGPRRRALVTIPGFGGGVFALSAIAKYVKQSEQAEAERALKAAFGDDPRRWCMPRLAMGESALQRVHKVVKAMQTLDPDTRITIVTFSGGGFIARCLLAYLMAEQPALYERVDLLVVKDGAMVGAHVPPSLFYLALIVEAAKKLGKGGLARDVSLAAEVPEELMQPLARELLYIWPTDFDAGWVTSPDNGIVWKLPLRPHPARAAILHQLAQWEYKRNWGQGITKVAYSNGSTAPFAKGTSVLMHLEATSVLYQFKLAMRTTAGRYDFLNLDLGKDMELKGSKIDHIGLHNTQVEPDGQVNYELAPGCHWGSTSQFDEILRAGRKALSKLKIVKAAALKSICYIPTTSSLFIDQPPSWIVGKTDEQIRAASRFDECHWAPSNLAHGSTHRGRALVDRILAG